MKEVEDDVEEAAAIDTADAVDEEDADKRNDREWCCWRFVRSTEFRGSTMERAKALAKESPGGDATVEDDDEESDTIVTIARSTIIVVIRMLSILLLLLMAVFDPMLVLLVFIILLLGYRKGLRFLTVSNSLMGFVIYLVQEKQ